MTDAELLRSIGLYYEKIAQHMGVSNGTIRNWACYGIPQDQRQALLDLREAVRQVVIEKRLAKHVLGDDVPEYLK